MGLAMARLARDVSNLSLASPVLSDPSSNGCHVALCTKFEWQLEWELYQAGFKIEEMTH